MLDEALVLPPGDHSEDWQTRLRAVLGDCFPQIAETLTGSPLERELHFELVKIGPRSLCLKLCAGGQFGFLKLFDGADGAVPYHREKAALHAMLDSGLVPGILAYSDELRFVLTDWIEARPVVVDDPRQVGFRTGAWLAAFDAVAPSEPASGNWFSYLSKFGSGLDLSQISSAQGMLSEIPLCGRVLSRNDAALHNYLVASDGTLLGCDFEQARMRPRGWDYLLGFAALIERFPDRSNEVIESYSEGFAQAHRGTLIVDELNAVARILFCARAMCGYQQQGATPWL